MSKRDFHKVIGAKPVTNFPFFSHGHFRFALIKHCFGKDDIAYGLHVSPYGEESKKFLDYLGFEYGINKCSHLYDKHDRIYPQRTYKCYTLEVPEKFDVECFFQSLKKAYLKLTESEEDFRRCGLSFDPPKEEEEEVRISVIGATRHRHRGDGHTGTPDLNHDSNKELEDNDFHYKLTLLESNSEKSWIIHYSPKQSPVSPELLSVLKFLGIRSYQKCPQYDFKPCHWYDIPFVGGIKPKMFSGFPTPYDNAHEVKMSLDSHTQHFSLGIQKLIAANVEMKKSGIEFLGIHDPEKHLVNTGIEPSLGNTKAQNPNIYEVAISFAGTERESARGLAETLKAKGVSVFFDELYPEKLWGSDLVKYLASVFEKESRYCVIFVSKDYKERAWPNHELRSAQARALEDRGGYILPIQVDDTKLDGLPSTIGYLPIADGIEKIAKILIAKLRS